MKKFVRAVDVFNEFFGKNMALLILPLVFVVVYEVIARKIFHSPTVWAFEVTVWLYGAHFMLGAAYTHLHDRHVRIDILSQKLPEKVQIWLSVITFWLLFVPFVGGLSYAAVSYAAHSWASWEHSWSAWKPPLYLYKTVMPVGLLLLFLQGAANFVRDIYRLKGEEI
ncbi:TRAP transporter small permease subunit [Desulfomonile tiedjei]|uniref:TRAP-type mannitol/chloroaromatic compound transport system, small permease component n=1 Tax=Desulfomonile tiedjei (strain ATCC 49306 / DSM 6799 / DCB-1) TaxID=706587 RepID=I4C5S9_DESTA|nr:TRAP transporter small permease subunit [Desulfomonile tiedjei]AFM24920.1 TRAP-type mannitol/chloroaromatic compound transport system, small permease component [Desulfomonile tiedjei DSM 6799]